MSQPTPNSVVVSGASGGIGTVLVEHFLRRNAIVYGIDKNAPAIHLNHAKYHFLQADLADYADIVRVVEQLARLTTSLAESPKDNSPGQSELASDGLGLTWKIILRPEEARRVWLATAGRRW
jgi:NAD(P)-dependent dehydrogenase (short-subunit alcohol dehydrogenase family)